MRRRCLNTELVVAVITSVVFAFVVPPARAAVTREQVETAIKQAVRYLKDNQRGDGSWVDADDVARTGTTSLIALALLTAGEPASSPTITKALDYLRNFSPEQLKSTYSVALQTMVFATATPERDQLKIAANVAWLERAQIKPGERVSWPGSWSYNEFKTQRGDNSNSQYALLGLNAASEVGVPVRPEVWILARRYWEQYQHNDGSFAYTPDAASPATASMTCAGISGLIITGLKRFQGQEFLNGDQIQNCGKGGLNMHLDRGINWMSRNFFVGQNFGNGQQWKYYYLYGLERAGRLSGQRFFGEHDWYREGAEELVHDQDKAGEGFWSGMLVEGDRLVATSFALLFLAKGRAPVLINKLRHNPKGDWNNDPDDIRNLTNLVSRDWKNLLTWQVVDPNVATVQDLMQAPIVFLNGHEAPEFTVDGKKALRDYVEQGGFIFAESCCGRAGFDKGFHQLMEELFPEPEYKLHPLAEDHAVWRSRHILKPDIHPLWGIEHGCRTVVIYSPEDLSCYWNQSETNPSNTSVIKALRVGQNVVDYATGRELPADKLTVREVRDFRPEKPKRGALQIAKLKHAGDWNVAPLAVPNLMTALRDKVGFDVVISHKELVPRDPNLVNFPLIYIHGRASLSFSQEDIAILRRHLEPGGGTLFADAACGSAAFDAAFRRFVGEMLPDNALVPIARDDEIYTKRVGYDLSDVQYSKAAGGGKDLPQLEGVKLNGHWAVIYSKYDIGCALERHQGLDCKGYTPESAVRIATNIVIYATLP
jgi:type II secretory pathway pseudopilin PulG